MFLLGARREILHFVLDYQYFLQMLKAEDDIEHLKVENSRLNQTGQQSAQTLGHFQDQLNQLELELTISQEKHRTCQKEVSVAVTYREAIHYCKIQCFS